MKIAIELCKHDVEQLKRIHEAMGDTGSLESTAYAMLLRGMYSKLSAMDLPKRDRP